ncbi:hypothetical protein CMQ_6621 [Grosmannia clavigera kw1407]|uniref:Biogenesis of lysosome-related organelles complex 1 subunit KXD1 n=1 Tax=Grosmannia clavigera (strain kw1407 / UAMH 11150) TaxID=655863 RepID=F0X7J2_GROCL|nr:uncharacterized protein CMQ_6621 [Grosmannia clavigera kw1407]EFX06300.1 hypothetical protein CMQ_6621 [Grosmannia clavigera kw1407]
MSPSYGSSMYTEALPMPVPAKDGYADYYQGYQGYQGGHSTYSVSPPESENAVSSASGGVSYSSPGYSATASYAGSMHGDYESSVSAGGVDFNEYMQDRFSNAFDPIPLDMSVAKQAHTSGLLNDKQRQLLELQQKAQARLAKMHTRFAEGRQDAREVRANLEWSQKKLTSLNAKASKKHSKEYKKARERYPSPEY